MRYQPIVALGASPDRRPLAVEALTSAPLHAARDDHRVGEDARAGRDGLIADDLRRLRAVVADLTALPAEVIDAASAATSAATSAPPCASAPDPAPNASPVVRLLPIFINLEPVSLSAVTAAAVHELLDPLLHRTSVIVEVTERRLLDDPAGLLRGIRHLRQAGCGIAVDDVGSTPAALALLSLIEPDVIKLDMGLLHDPFNSCAAATFAAARDQANRTGALVLAEGVETEEQEQLALSTGADLGQGWLYGRSLDWPPLTAEAGDGPLQQTVLESVLRTARTNLAAASWPHRSPFTVLSGSHIVRSGSQRLLTQMSRHLEDQALHNTDNAVVLAALTTPDALHGLTRRRFEALGQAATFTAISAPDMPRRPCPGVLGQPLDPLSPISGEWVITVLTPFFAGMLAARPRRHPQSGEHDGRQDHDPRQDHDFACALSYDFALSYDRASVIEASRCLVRELDPLTADAVTADVSADVSCLHGKGSCAEQVPRTDISHVG